MRIRVFGAFGAVGDDGEELSVGGPKQRTVLALLSVEPGRQHRGVLCGCLGVGSRSSGPVWNMFPVDKIIIPLYNPMNAMQQEGNGISRSLMVMMADAFLRIAQGTHDVIQQMEENNS